MICSGFKEKRESILNWTDALSGLFLGGNYISGVSIGNCVECGERLANEICNYTKN